MMHFTVNLARRPAENLRRAWIVWGGLLAVLSAVLVVFAAGVFIGAWNTRRIDRQQADVEARMAPLQAREAVLDRQLKDPDVRAALARARFLNGLIDRKSVSWTRLFEQLEKTLPYNLKVISIRPQQQSGTPALLLVVAAGKLQPAIEFVSQLEQSTDFANAQVLRVARRDATPDQPAQVRVEIQTQYQPPLHPAAPSVLKADDLRQPAPPSLAAPPARPPVASPPGSHPRQPRPGLRPRRTQ